MHKESAAASATPEQATAENSGNKKNFMKNLKKISDDRDDKRNQLKNLTLRVCSYCKKVPDDTWKLASSVGLPQTNKIGEVRSKTQFKINSRLNFMIKFSKRMFNAFLKFLLVRVFCL